MINLDYLDPVVLTGFVRELPSAYPFILNQFLPDRNIGDIEAVWDTVTRTNRAAKFRSYDAETNIGKRDQFERKRTALPPLGQKTVIGEYERLILERVRSGGDNRNRTVEAIYDEAATNTRAVYARMELARGDVLTDGKFTLSGENGLTIEADFGVDPSHLVAPTTLWSDHDDADPISDMLGWTETYTDDTGEAPAWVVLTRSTVGHLLQNAKIRAFAASLSGTPQIVTRAQLATVLDAYGLPQIREYNAQVDVDGVATRPIPANRAIFLPSDPNSLGFTAWGITAEALELASGGSNAQLTFEQLPGLVGVVLKEGEPFRLWTKVGAVGMPVITDPRRLMVATVL